MSKSHAALVMSAGGARGAYQVGVVKSLLDMGLISGNKSPFDIYCGVSAGSINSAGLSCMADDFPTAVSQIENIWENLSAEQVFKTDIRSIGGIGVKWMRDLSLGGVLGGGSPKSLLDTAPLRDLLSKNLPLHRIRRHIESGELHALAITATNYYTSNAVSFVQTKEETNMWTRARRLSERTEINIEHLMASSAIPFFFPSVEINGRHFGDGAVRNIAPISPAVHLGADRILAIGVRKEMEVSETTHGPRAAPSVAHIAGYLLDAVLLDSIEMDIVRMKRINDILQVLNTENLESDGQVYRPLKAAWISPSEDIGQIATQHFRRLPRVVRYMLKGLGPDAQTTDIVSFLLFDPTFCSRLIELGYNDGMKSRDEVLKLFDD